MLRLGHEDLDPMERGNVVPGNALVVTHKANRLRVSSRGRRSLRPGEDPVKEPVSDLVLASDRPRSRSPEGATVDSQGC